MMMMMIVPNSRARKGGKEVKGEYGRRGMLQPSQQHVPPKEALERRLYPVAYPDCTQRQDEGGTMMLERLRLIY